MDGTRVPYIGRQILNLWTTRKVLCVFQKSMAPSIYFSQFLSKSNVKILTLCVPMLNRNTETELWSRKKAASQWGQFAIFLCKEGTQ